MTRKTMDLRNKLPGEGQAWEGMSLTHIRIILAKKSQLNCLVFILFFQHIDCNEFITCTRKPSEDVKFYEHPSPQCPNILLQSAISHPVCPAQGSSSSHY